MTVAILSAKPFLAPETDTNTRDERKLKFHFRGKQSHLATAYSVFDSKCLILIFRHTQTSWVCEPRPHSTGCSSIRQARRWRWSWAWMELLEAHLGSRSRRGVIKYYSFCSKRCCVIHSTYALRLRKIRIRKRKIFSIISIYHEHRLHIPSIALQQHHYFDWFSLKQKEKSKFLYCCLSPIDRMTWMHLGLEIAWH